MDGDTLLILFYIIFSVFLYVSGIFFGLIVVYSIISIKRYIRRNQFKRCLADINQYGLTPAEAYTARMMK